MGANWLIWLACGSCLVMIAAMFAALEATLWQAHARHLRNSDARLDTRRCRDCTFIFLTACGAFARASGWWCAWIAAVLLAKSTSFPDWGWAIIFLSPMVLFEVVPGITARRFSKTYKRFLYFAEAVSCRLFGTFYDALRPSFVAMALRISPWAVKKIPPLGSEEAETLVQMREEEGMFTLAEAEALEEVLRLSQLTVRHYMTPRVDVLFVRDEMTNDEVREFLRKRRLTRIPVVGETHDEIVGILDTRVLSRLPKDMHFTEVLLPPSYVPETMEAAQLFANFLRHKQPLAVVLDEFGGVEGIVTIQDFLEQILGVAAPRVDANLYIEQLDDGRLLINGTVRLDDLEDYIGFDATSDGAETIGGYIINTLGKLPRQGDSVSLGNWKATVRSMVQRRIREVSLERVKKNNEREEEY